MRSLPAQYARPHGVVLGIGGRRRGDTGGSAPSLAVAAVSGLRRGWPASLPGAGNRWFAFVCGLRRSADNCIPQRDFPSNFDKVKIEMKLGFCS